jgi:hypothetical protein
MRSDGWSERICVPKGLAKKYSRYFARYVDDSDEPQELKWGDLWGSYVQGSRTNSGLTSENQLSRHENGDSDTPQKSGLYKTQPYESRQLEQNQAVQPRTTDTNQSPGNAIAPSHNLDPLRDGSMILTQEDCIVKIEENSTKHQEAPLLDFGGYNGVLGDDVVVQYQGSFIKAEKGKIIYSEFPGYQKGELCRGTLAHQSGQQPAVSEAQDCCIRLPKCIEQTILEKMQVAGITVSGMDLSGTLKDVIAREGRKQHIDEFLKHQEYMKDDLWEVFKIFFKWIVSGRIVREPYSRPNSADGSTLDLSEVLWHGRMFLSKEFTTTLHRTIKLEGGSITHKLNPSRLDTIKFAKLMYDNHVKEHFELVKGILAKKAGDAAKRREAERQVQEARDEEAERAVGPNLDAALAIDNFDINECTLPSMARETPGNLFTPTNRENPSPTQLAETAHTDIAPRPLRLPIVGACYDIDIRQGSGTRQATLTTSKPRAQHVRGSCPPRAYRQGDSCISRNRCHSPDCNHRTDRSSRDRRPARPSRNNGTHRSTEDSRSHHRKSNARDSPQINPVPGKARREDKYSDNEYHSY